MKYNLQKAVDFIKNKFSNTAISINNSKFDRQAEADYITVIKDISLFCKSELLNNTLSNLIKSSDFL